ncbi:MAG: hypothetical protein HGA24_02135, partial [Candidatus Aminicenantes bacterium]|nr:hypothetical protein [Candidatus Aminicenantes bacterium]
MAGPCRSSLNCILQIPVTVSAGPPPFPLRTRRLSQLDKLGDKAKALGAKGLVWIKKQDGWKSSLKMAGADFERIWAELGGAEADLALLIADKKETALKALGEIRRTWPIEDAGRKDRLAFCWVTGFPLFE